MTALTLSKWVFTLLCFHNCCFWIIANGFHIWFRDNLTENNYNDDLVNLDSEQPLFFKQFYIRYRPECPWLYNVTQSSIFSFEDSVTAGGVSAVTSTLLPTLSPNFDNFTWFMNDEQAFNITNNQTDSPDIINMDSKISKYWIKTLNFTSKDTASISDVLTNICPTSRLSCSAIGHPQASGGEGCCVQCDCTADCHAIGNCCQDYDGQPQLFVKGLPATTILEVCLYPELKNKYACDDTRHSSAQLMVAACSESYADLATYSKCMQPSVDILDEVQPVYNPTLPISYINKHCAKCNYVDEESLVTWDAKLVCGGPTFFSLSYLPQYFSLILSTLHTRAECSIVWMPPPGAQHRPCYPDQDLSTDCPQKYLAPNVRDLCVSGPKQPYGSPATRMYRNMFCFGCDLPVIQMHDHSCMEVKESRWIKGRMEALIHPVAYGPFYRTEMLNPHGHDDGKCPTGLTYNEETDECLHIVCASPMLPYNGQCVSIVTALRYMNLHYHIRVSIPFAKFKRVPMPTIESQIRSMVHDEKEKNDDYICDQTVLSRKVGDKLQLDFKFTKYVTSFVDLKNVYEQLEMKVNNISTDDFQIDIDQLPHSDMLHIPEIITYQYESFPSNICPLTGAAVSKLQFCKTVLFQLKQEILPNVTDFPRSNENVNSNIDSSLNKEIPTTPVIPNNVLFAFDQAPESDNQPNTEVPFTNDNQPNTELPFTSDYPPSTWLLYGNDNPHTTELPFTSDDHSSSIGNPVNTEVPGLDNKTPPQNVLQFTTTADPESYPNSESPQTVNGVTLEPSDYVMVWDEFGVNIKVCLDTYNTKSRKSRVTFKDSTNTNSTGAHLVIEQHLLLNYVLAYLSFKTIYNQVCN